MDSKNQAHAVLSDSDEDDSLCFTIPNKQATSSALQNMQQRSPLLHPTSGGSNAGNSHFVIPTSSAQPCTATRSNSNTSTTSNMYGSAALNPTKQEADIVAHSLVGVVDIGSNGIRFSISSTAPHHARSLPCVFKDRLNVSLFDSQFISSTSSEKLPIPNEVIYEVCRAMKRFQIICHDFGVNSNVRVVATEATREAYNSKYFRDCIFQTTGWQVQLLSKEEEARIGSLGVVSSFNNVSGLFMDMGGGSIQLNWIHTTTDGAVQYSPNPISLPYGAAVLTRRLKNEPLKSVFLEIKQAFTDSLHKLDIPKFLLEKAEDEGGFQVFCSGGGLRGIGYLMLAMIDSYPIPNIINGFACNFIDVSNLANYLFLKSKLPTKYSPNAFNSDFSHIGYTNNNNPNNINNTSSANNSSSNSPEIFRLSERRKKQLPAIGLLLSAAFEALPKIRSLNFSQGGVREGILFDTLPISIRTQDPLIVATQPYAPFLQDKYLQILLSSIPIDYIPLVVPSRIAPALCNLAFVHSMYQKELQPTAALQVATTGIIAGSHGLSHRMRSLIGIALLERWGGELPFNQQCIKNELVRSVLKEEGSNIKNKNNNFLNELIFWTIYVGKIMYFICGIHPGGNISDYDKPFQFRVKHKKKKSNSSPTNKDSNENESQEVFEVILIIDTGNLKIGSGAGNRIKSISKKIKKLAKLYNIKLKFEVEKIDSTAIHQSAEVKEETSDQN